ncbi:MAG: RhuM family protein [Tannerellaceae bacterium]
MKEVKTDSEDSLFNLEALLKNDETWLTLEALAELFEVEVSVIGSCIKLILEAQELDEGSTIRNFRIVENDEEIEVTLYNLQVVFAVGYRIESRVGTLFRTWAGKILTAYSQNGFVIDQERIRKSNKSNDRCFDNLMECILSL